MTHLNDLFMGEINIKFHKYGILVSGNVYLDLVKYFIEFAETRGYYICDSLIASHYQSSICYTSPVKSKKWRKKLGIKIQE